MPENDVPTAREEPETNNAPAPEAGSGTKPRRWQDPKWIAAWIAVADKAADVYDKITRGGH